MPEHGSTLFLRDFAIVLSTAALATLLFRRFRLPLIAGYLVAGVLVGSDLAPRLISDPNEIRTLAEVGVVLLMMSVGLELRFRRLVRMGPRLGLVALIEVGIMFSLGLATARALGWSGLDSVLAAGIVAISSTMVIAKVFEGRRQDWRLRDLVFGVLVMEDLVAIALIAVCTTLAFGARVSAGSVASVLGRLAFLLGLMLTVGLLIVPPVIRMVVHRHRSETVLVTAVGLGFFAALLTQAEGYSVALGAFVAGVLMSESGVGRQVGEVIAPVRDLFAAVFFVAVGMLLDVSAALEAWPLVLLFTALVVTGKVVGVTVGAFLSGFGSATSIRAGMSMAQIGEFSFLIAGLGATSASSSAPLYPIAVATALLTSLATPILAGQSERAAFWIDRRLPKPLQTFSSLYASWVEALWSSRSVRRSESRIGRRVGFLLIDAAAITILLVAASEAWRKAPAWLAAVGLSIPFERFLVSGAILVAALPFAFGFTLTIRRLAAVLADAVVPPVAPGKVDQGRAPRRMLVITLEIAMLIGAALPVVAITLPFLPPFGAPGVVAVLLLLLLASFWRTARDLDSHARAGAELVVHVLARQGDEADAESFELVRTMLPGLGNLVPLRIGPRSAVAGRSLGELNIRGLTGATVVALCRGHERRVFPPATERLAPGDLIAVTGSLEAIDRAEALVRAADGSSAPSDRTAMATGAERPGR